jgi:hypothetical protein
MNKFDIIEFLKAEVEPLPDRIYGNRYRASAYLIDGTYLPCVVFQSKGKQVDLALKRFEQEKNQPDQYRMVVEVFVASDTRVDDYNITSVEVSPFAWPLSILRTIEGETTMAWTAFVVEMNDGKRFSYGTSYLTEFFDLPKEYSFKDITRIHSGMVHSETEGTLQFTHELHPQISYFREKPFFTCYIDGIEA